MTSEQLLLREVFDAQFRALREVFPGLAGLPHDFIWPSLVYAGEDAGKVAEIRPNRDSAPVIVVYDGFLKSLQHELERSGPTLRDACLVGVPDERTARDLSRAVIAGLVDFCAAFLLAHECQHYAGGHLTALSRRKAAFDESAFGMAADTRAQTKHRRGSLRERYFLEHECDGVGLQSVMQGAISPQVKLLMSQLGSDANGVHAIFEAPDGLGRLVGFRMVVAALWLTVGVLEQREPGSSENVSSHPLPGARLLAGFSTILQQFAELKDDPRHAEGLNTRILSEEDATAIRTFLFQVLQPIVLARLAVSGVRERDEVLRSSEVGLLRDLGHLFTQQKPQTAAGLELLAVQRLHTRMTATLAPHRLGRKSKD